MSFSTYCRECSIHFAEPVCKDRHVATHHYGVAPNSPRISEQTFYLINANRPEVKAKTCPVCLIYFTSLHQCVIHIALDHQITAVRTATTPTRLNVIAKWVRLVDAVFPRHLNAIYEAVREAASDEDDDDSSVASSTASTLDVCR